MDIDLCDEGACPIRNKCKRFKPNQRAFYFHPQYRDGECILFIPKTNEKAMDRKKSTKV